MRNIKNFDYNVKYPSKEKACVFRPENGVPFDHAIVGVTYPLEDYYIVRGAYSKVVNLEYVVEGEGEILLDGVWKTASAGDFFILRSQEPHEYRSKKHNPWHKIWINYCADYTLSLLDAYNVKSGIYKAADTASVFLQALELSSSAYVTVSTCYTLAEYVHKIIASASLRKAAETSCDEYRIREMLNASIYKKVDLDSISDALHMSKSNLIRIFKSRYGVTPYNYLIDSKMETAKLLMVNSSLSVREIADMLCISDEHYFSTLFYRRVGMRPRDYKNLYKSHTEEHDVQY